MRRFLLQIRLFFLLFECAGRPPLASFLRGGATLTAWFAAVSLPAGVIDGDPVAWSVFAFLVAGHSLNLNANLRRLRPEDLPGVFSKIVLLWGLLFGLMIWSPDPIWFQRIFTVLPLLFAATCLIDMIDGRGTFSALFWPRDEMQTARPALIRAFFLKHLAFALLNETLIATAPTEAWVICLALLPFIQHYVNSALTTTILLDANIPDDPGA